MHRSRKKKLLRLIKKQILETVIQQDTFYVFLDLKGGLGPDFARMMLKQSVTDIVREILDKKQLGCMYYAEGYPQIIDRWVSELVLLGAYPLPSKTPGREKFVFHHPSGPKAKRMFFLVGDGVVSKLEAHPVLRLEVSNSLFDLIGRKCDPDSKPLVFADGNRLVNIFSLKSDS